MVRGYLPVPRPSDMIYAPMDVAQALCSGIVARGHQVTFFGPLGTKLDVPTETLKLRPLARSEAEFTNLMFDVAVTTHNIMAMWDQKMVWEMFERARAGEFDLLHLHHPEIAYTYARMYPDVPVVYTIHDPVDELQREVYEMYKSDNQYFISISDNQRLAAPDLPYIGTVWNGIDTDEYCLPKDRKREDYLIFAGRIVPEKGVKEAIEIAKKTGHRLLIIGPTYPSSQDYFDQCVRPQLDDQILYLGFMERRQVIKYFQKAKGLLFPIQWEEPFGMTMVEAMACGAPVIGYRRGAVPEVVKDGKTGFIVDTLADMAAAVGKLGMISQQDCHNYVEQYFSVRRMVNSYIQTFQLVLDRFNMRTLTGTKS
jgi:glycosyltransferase involved in cell wall biosynthesis